MRTRTHSRARETGRVRQRTGGVEGMWSETRDKEQVGSNQAAPSAMQRQGGAAHSRGTQVSPTKSQPR